MGSLGLGNGSLRMDDVYLEGATPDGPAVVGHLSVIVDTAGITFLGPEPGERRTVGWERTSPLEFGRPGRPARRGAGHLARVRGRRSPAAASGAFQARPRRRGTRDRTDRRGVCCTRVGRRATRVGRRATGVGGRAADLGRRTTGVGCRAADLGCRAADLGRRTADLGRRTADLGRRTTGVGRHPGGIACLGSSRGSPIDPVGRATRVVASRTTRVVAGRAAHTGHGDATGPGRGAHAGRATRSGRGGVPDLAEWSAPSGVVEDNFVVTEAGSEAWDDTPPPAWYRYAPRRPRAAHRPAPTSAQRICADRSLHRSGRPAPDRGGGRVLPDAGTTGHISGVALSDAAIAGRVGIQPGDLAGWSASAPTMGNVFAAGATTHGAAALNTAEQASTVLARCLHVPASAVDGAFGMGDAITQRSAEAASPSYADPAGNGGAVSSVVDVVKTPQIGQADADGLPGPGTVRHVLPALRAGDAALRRRWRGRGIRHRHGAARGRPGARGPGGGARWPGSRSRASPTTTGRPRRSSPRRRRCSTGACRPRSER